MNETPTFLIFEYKPDNEYLEKLKRKGLVPIAIEGDNYIFRISLGIEY